MMTGFMLGAVVGAGLALLLAPATGEETRRRLKETATRFREEADEAVGNVKERFDEMRHGQSGSGGGEGGTASRSENRPGSENRPRTEGNTGFSTSGTGGAQPYSNPGGRPA
jgi:hypothetical protein